MEPDRRYGASRMTAAPLVIWQLIGYGGQFRPVLALIGRIRARRGVEGFSPGGRPK